MQMHQFFIFPDLIQPNYNNARVCKLPPVLQPQLPKGGAGRRTSQEYYGRLVQYAKSIPVENQAQTRGKEAHTAPFTSCAIAVTYFALASTLADTEKHRNKSSFHVCLALQRELFFFCYSSVVFAILLHCL